MLCGQRGFIGRHLLTALMSDSRYEVRGFEGDITHNEDVVRNLRDIDTVINLAALTFMPTSWDSPNAYVETNLNGMVNILKNHTLYNRLIYQSTVHIYGDQPKIPIEVDAIPLPQDPYSVTKWAAEVMLEAYRKRYHFKALTVRPFNCYGPGQAHHFAIPTFCLSALRDKRITVRGNTKREFVYVKDTVRALKLMLDRGTEGLVQISRGHSYEMSHVARTIAALAGLGKEAVTVEPVSRPMDVADLHGSPKSLIKAVGSFEFTSLEYGLGETLDSFKQIA